ncbi:MAG: nucleotide exchange factor GrpE [Candidatus Dormibacteria bacterium]
MARHRDDTQAEHMPPAKDNPSSAEEGNELSPAAARLIEQVGHGALAEQYVRLAADFDNYRRRTVHELDERRRSGIEHAITALLPVLDNLRRAVDHAAEDDSTPSAFLEGLRMVMKGFEDGLNDLGIEAIATEGEPFDPTLHEAIMSEESNEVEREMVIGELQRGYRFQDHILRPALVRVAYPALAASPAVGSDSTSNTDSTDDAS